MLFPPKKNIYLHAFTQKPKGIPSSPRFRSVPHVADAKLVRDLVKRRRLIGDSSRNMALLSLVDERAGGWFDGVRF